MESGAFRENLLAVLEERYDMGGVRTIRVHGDGGTWIQGLSEILPGMTFLMDEFHIEQYMKSLQNRTKDAEKRRRLRTALENNDPEGFFVTGVEIAQEQEKAGEKEVHETARIFPEQLGEHPEPEAVRGGSMRELYGRTDQRSPFKKAEPGPARME